MQKTTQLDIMWDFTVFDIDYGYMWDVTIFVDRKEVAEINVIQQPYCKKYFI